MKHLEKFILINYKEELLFLDSKTQRLFDLIVQSNFGPSGRFEDYNANYSLTREGEIVDSGVFKCFGPGEYGFTSKNIFQEYWNNNGHEGQQTSNAFVPEMFLKDDILWINHNSSHTISSTLKLFEPSLEVFMEKHKGFWTNEMFNIYFNEAIEIFPEVYRIRTYDVSQKIADLFKAVNLIEQDGDEAIETTTKLVGKDVAIALYISKLRKDFNSEFTYPAGYGVEERIMNTLIKKRLLF